jgi:hypothetical protein
MSKIYFRTQTPKHIFWYRWVIYPQETKRLGNKILLVSKTKPDKTKPEKTKGHFATGKSELSASKYSKYNYKRANSGSVNMEARGRGEGGGSWVGVENLQI